MLNIGVESLSLFLWFAEKRFEEPVPACIQEAREFCECYVRQMRMKRYEKQKLVRWVWLQSNV